MRLLWRHLAVPSRRAWPQIRGYSDTIDTVYTEALQWHKHLPDNVQKRGLSILKTPITPFGLFICGVNPGRNADVVREPQKKPPIENELMKCDSAYAKTLRKWFGEPHEETLRNANITNTFFWGSERWKEFQSKEYWDSQTDVRDDVKTFCFKKVGEMVIAVRPAAILLCGLDNANLWQKHIMDDWVADSEEKRVFRKGLAQVKDLEVQTLAVSHPSGAWGRTPDENDILVKTLHAFLEAHGPDVPNVP